MAVVEDFVGTLPRSHSLQISIATTLRLGYKATIRFSTLWQIDFGVQ
jgi:hypothetical protein